MWQANDGPTYLDYFPEVDGTRPEKMIFNELARRRINFYFSYYFGDIPFTPDVQERYRPDFMLPDYNIIIDVQGIYWHTRPGKYESDYVRASQLAAAGWRMVLITDYEIEANVVEAIDRNVPELINPIHTGTLRAWAERGFHPTAPIIARIQKRPKKVNTKWSKRPLRGRPRAIQPISTWKANKPPKSKVIYGPLFEIKDFDIDYLSQVQEYTGQWRDYLAILEDFFKDNPIVSYTWIGNDQGEGYWTPVYASSQYPEEYSYWLRWRFWWQRFKSQ